MLLSVLPNQVKAMINRINKESGREILSCLQVITASFKPVAEEFQLTPINAPTHPAFLTLSKFKAYLKKKIELFGLYEYEKLIGCVAIEKSDTDKNLYFIERVAVIPEKN